MQLIKSIKKVYGKVDQAKVILQIFCLLSDIKLSESELTTLAYYAIYKSNEKVKELVLEGKILKSIDSLRNTISKLSNIGLLKKSPVNKEYTVTDKIKFDVEPTIGFLIKIDNS
jgi:DNA replication protein DnaD